MLKTGCKTKFFFDTAKNKGASLPEYLLDLIQFHQRLHRRERVDIGFLDGFNKLLQHGIVELEKAKLEIIIALDLHFSSFAPFTFQLFEDLVSPDRKSVVAGKR